jgi:hypothetical protein
MADWATALLFSETPMYSATTTKREAAAMTTCITVVKHNFG